MTVSLSCGDARIGVMEGRGHRVMLRGGDGAMPALMSRRMPGALSAAAAWLVDPADPATLAVGAPLGRRPVIAVFGLSRRCGATVVARALATVLATRDASGTAAVWSPATGGGGLPIAARPATRLAGVLADVPGASTRAAGRLCLVGGAEPVPAADTACHHAPLVLDVGATAGGAPATIADRVVLVAAPGLEPALARVVASGLARVGPEPLVVLNRVALADPRWAHVTHTLPESRVGARVAVAGHESRGAFGQAVRAVADSLVGVT